MNNVRYIHGSKHDVPYKRTVKATCGFCLERATFRVVLIEVTDENGSRMVNHVACTRCLKTVRYNKRIKIIQHSIIKVVYLTTEEKITRQYKRIKRWFTGDHIYKSFGRKRTK